MDHTKFLMESTQRILFVVCACIVAFAILVNLFINPLGAIFPALLLVVVLVSWGVQSSRAATLTPDAITMRGFGTKTIPWQQVADVRVADRGMTRRVQLVLADGSVRKLPVPFHTPLQPDSQLERKVLTIRQSWKAGCGEVTASGAPRA